MKIYEKRAMKTKEATTTTTLKQCTERGAEKKKKRVVNCIYTQ